MRTLDRDAEARDLEQLDVVLAVAERHHLPEVQPSSAATNAIPDPFVTAG